MKQRWSKKPFYSLSQERIPLDPDFPVFLLSFSVPHDPIRDLHKHGVLELGVCLRGNGVFIIGNTIHPYEEGDMIAIAPGVYHRAKSGLGMDDLWNFFYFDPADWSLPEQPNGIHRLIKQSADPHLHSLMVIVAEEIRCKQRACRESVAGLLTSISVRISRLNDSEPDDGLPAVHLPLSEVDERIIRAMDCMINAESQHYHIPELAEACHLSESHFRHVFKAQVGMSPKRFQTILKISMAMNRLKSCKARVLDIAYECGFESLSSFNRHFKRETGLSPLQWRARTTR